ncbi:MAG: helix-turn-helix domain-containing protein [Alistipes sp.]|nr:helix-turn-helix domain-containing protein [Alistipes sp.]
MEIISMDSRVFDNIVHRVTAIEQKAMELCRKQEDLALKDWLDNQEVCQILSISPRTLQTYRDKGIISFSCIRQKIYYRPEDVEKVLRSSYHKAHGK